MKSRYEKKQQNTHINTSAELPVVMVDFSLSLIAKLIAAKQFRSSGDEHARRFLLFLR